MQLGIDIGGTTINLGLVRDGAIVQKVTVPSFPPEATLEQTLDYLATQIQSLMTPEVTRIGIGVPTLVDPVTGIVHDACNIPSWKEVPLKQYLEDRFWKTVRVENDANCFIIGAHAMLCPTSRVTVGITLGTGTGFGILMNGKLFSGANCGAGEIGSFPYNGGVFENFCSKQFFENRGWGGKQASQAAQNGNQKVLEMFEEFGMHMGKLLSLVMYAYDPDCIVIGGGIAHSAPLFEKAMLETLRAEYLYGSSLDRLQIHYLPDGDAAMLGASLL